MSDCVCQNSLSDAAGIRIPRILQHLITRPLTHFVKESRSPGLLAEGFLLMEFDGQVFRRDIAIPHEHKCKYCGHEGKSLKDRYTEEIEKKSREIARLVKRAVRERLEEALTQVTTERWTYDPL